MRRVRHSAFRPHIRRNGYCRKRQTFFLDRLALPAKHDPDPIPRPILSRRLRRDYAVKEKKNVCTLTIVCNTFILLDMDAQNEIYLSPLQVAEKLNVTRTAIYQWIANGELTAERKPSARKKPEYIIRKADLIAFIEARGLKITL